MIPPPPAPARGDPPAAPASAQGRHFPRHYVRRATQPGRYASPAAPRPAASRVCRRSHFDRANGDPPPAALLPRRDVLSLKPVNASGDIHRPPSRGAPAPPRRVVHSPLSGSGVPLRRLTFPLQYNDYCILGGGIFLLTPNADLPANRRRCGGGVADVAFPSLRRRRLPRSPRFPSLLRRRRGRDGRAPLAPAAALRRRGRGRRVPAPRLVATTGVVRAGPGTAVGGRALPRASRRAPPARWNGVTATGASRADGATAREPPELRKGAVVE